MKARGWLPHEGNIWLDESADAVLQGIASEGVVQRLSSVPAFKKTLVRWRSVVSAALTLFLLLLIGIGMATHH